MEEKIINYEEMSWQKAERYPEGTEIKSCEKARVGWPERYC